MFLNCCFIFLSKEGKANKDELYWIGKQEDLTGHWKAVNWQLIKRKIELEKLIWEQRGVKLMIADRTINKVIQQSNRIAKKTDRPKHSNFSVWALSVPLIASSACMLVLPTWSRDAMRRQAFNKMTSLLRRHHSKAVSLNMICGTSAASDSCCCYNPVLYLMSSVK